MNKYIISIIIASISMQARAQVSTIVDETLPDKIGVGTHSTLVKSMSNLLGIALRANAPDVLKYKPVTTIEYHNGSAWVTYNTEDWKNVLDGVDGNGWAIPYNQVRFTVDLQGTWIRPSAFLIGQDWQSGERYYDMTVESSIDQVSWSVRLAPTSTGGSNTALNLFMIDEQTNQDRYIRLTIQSLADAANPLYLTQVSGFSKRFVGLADNTTLPFYSDYDRNIGIGTTTPAYKLSVNGIIGAKEVKVTSTGWSDFVFEPDYDLPTLQEVENFINQNGHLPDIPSAEEVAENGISLGEMDAKLLQKIEELTLYVIELKRENEELKGKASRIDQLEILLNKLLNSQN